MPLSCSVGGGGGVATSCPGPAMGRVYPDEKSGPKRREVLRSLVQEEGREVP